MTIEWFGLSSFKIQSKIHNEEVVIVTDPPQPSAGFKLPRNLAANILTVSNQSSNANNIEAVGSNPFIITAPGEYEVKNVFVYGLRGGKGQVAYRFEMEDLVLAHLGGLESALKDEDMEKFENIDILFIPVGGGTGLDAKQAAAVANQLQPRVVIPMNFETPGVEMKLDSVSKFLKEMGASKVEPIAKYKVSKKDLPQEEMQVVVLDPS